MTPGLFEAFGGVPRWHAASAATPVSGLRLTAERLFDALEDDFAVTADRVVSQLKIDGIGKIRYRVRDISCRS